MTGGNRSAAKKTLAALRTRLVAWLVDDAYPLWSHNGIDPRNGGFEETLDQRGAALLHPRRARLHPRQVYAFAQAPKFGWRGDAAGIVRRGLNYFTHHYRRGDGLIRTLADAAGATLDTRALLYDQAFALLGYAAAATAPDAREEFEAHALQLRAGVENHFAAADGAFFADETRVGYCEANPHMHLLEAYLAWTKIGHDAGWAARVGSLVDLALRRFIRGDSGALGESYLWSWQPAPAMAGHIIEPGHQFEWAWLLLRCEGLHPSSLREAALRLISVGEEFGVHNGVAVNALLDDFTIKDANARFWPQSERLKAALLAAQLTDQPRYWSMAAAAAASFLPFLNTPITGLWFDVQRPDGAPVDAPAPASTFYHLVGAIGALDTACAAAGAARVSVAPDAPSSFE